MIKKLLKIIAVITAGVFGICMFFLVLGGIIFGWNSPSCNEDSEAVMYARSLSQERLALLYSQMQEESVDDKVPYQGYTKIGDQKLPDKFSDLNVVKVRPKRGNIMIQGCFDHYVYLHFKGMKGDSPREIVLSYNEFPVKSEVLWRSE